MDQLAHLTCPFCGSTINPGAVVCTGCGAYEATIGRAKRLNGLLATYTIAWLLLLAILGNELLQHFTFKDAGAFLGLVIVGGAIFYGGYRYTQSKRWWRRMY